LFHEKKIDDNSRSIALVAEVGVSLRQALQ
jgi:hypothetical protein